MIVILLLIYSFTHKFRGLMDTFSSINMFILSTDSEAAPRYVKQQRGFEVNSVGRATGGVYPKTGFDVFETADLLKQHNIFVERDRVRLGEDIGHGTGILGLPCTSLIIRKIKDKM